MYKIFVYEDRYEYINELIVKVKNNDGSALGELYDFYKPLFICAIQRCIQKESKLSPYREDMLQESLLVLKKIVDQYNPNLTYFSYFLSTRIDINLFRSCSDKYLDHADYENDVVVEEHSTDPFNRIETVISLHSAINKLNDKQKEAIELYFFEGLDQEEASLKLNISQSSFSKRLQRALGNIKVILGEDFLSF